MTTDRADDGRDETTPQSDMYRHGSLTRRLLGWFLIVALVPLTVVSAISYYTAKESLRDDAFDSVSADVEAKAAFISNWFRYRFIDLESQATSVDNAEFLEELSDAFEAEGNDLGAFVKSYRWSKIVSEHGEALKTFQKLYGDHDAFLIDTEGNILFTVEGKSDLGTNLFDGPYAKSRLAAACRTSFDTGRPAFSDLEHYAPSNSAVAGFLTNVMVNEDGDKIGVFAIQLPLEQIESAMRANAEVGTYIEAYIVGNSYDTQGVSLRSMQGRDVPSGDAATSGDSPPTGARLDT